jgi:hypothetical protein
LTGLVYNSAGISAYYFRDGDTSATSITLATASVGTWATGGFKEISSTNMPGFYEFDIPDAVIASGAKWATVMLKGAANMVQHVMHFNLAGNNPYAAALSSGANTGIASALLATAVETGVTVQQMLELIGASVAGNYDSATGTFKAVSNSGTTRITTVLSSGNRTNTNTP